ncbi:MAG TPA: hypothetical protein VGO00_03780 [Kofleriaceae bacterium]|nr:hypothetical protein [Kofleriaceae bacterium]
MNEVERARQRAASDPQAAAIVENVRVPDDVDINAMLDDCPECRAARERGEQPHVVSMPPAWKRRQPRWRDLKRHVRR